MTKSRIIGLTVLGLILLFLIFGSIFVVQESAIGTSLLSLQKVDLVSNFIPLDGEAWVYTFRMGGLGQKAVGIIDADDVSVEGKRPLYDFEFSAEMTKQECVYDITPTSDTKIYSIDKITGEGDAINFLGSCVPGEWEKVCTDNSKEALFAYRYGLLKCQIICGTPLTSVVGNLDTLPDLNSLVELTATSKGVTNTFSFNTLTDETKGKIGNNVYSIWQGDLSSGVNCPDSTQYKPIYKNNKWVLVNEQKYDEYRDILNDVENVGNNDDYNLWLERHNRAKSQALQTQSFGDIENPSEMFNSQIKSEIIGRPVSIPIITAYIKTDWLGIYTPVGEPKIINADSECFIPSSSGIIVVDVKNVGDDLGSFTITANCDNDLFNLKHSVPVTIKSGETQKVYLPISGGDTNKKVDSRCKVIVNGISSSDSMYTDVCINPLQTCTIGQLQCVENDIKICDQYGTGWNLYKTCDNNAQCVYDKNYKPYCKLPEVKNDNVCGDGVCTGLENKLLCPDDCKPVQTFEWFKQVGFGLLAVIFGLMIFLTGKIIMNKFGGGGQTDSLTLWILAILSLAVAGLIYLVVVQFWLWILIIVSIIALILMIIKVVL